MKLSKLNFKTFVTREQSEQLQKKLFSKGGRFADGSQQVYHSDYMFIYCNNGVLKVGNSIVNFDKTVNKCVEFHDAMNMIAKVKTTKEEPKIKLIEFDIDENGFIKDTTSQYNENLLNDSINGYVVNAFGGVQYIEPISGEKSNFVGYPLVCYKNGFSNSFFGK